MLHYPYATAAIADARQRDLHEDAARARLVTRARRANRARKRG